MNPNTLLSFVVPVKDEAATIMEFYSGISEQVTNLGHQFELIFIDEGSVDETWKKIQSIAGGDFRVRGMRYHPNLGKGVSQTAGLKAARGKIIFLLDVEFPNAPAEIGRFLDKLGESFDVVSGKRDIYSGPWYMLLPRVIANLTGFRDRDGVFGVTCCRSRLLQSLEISSHAPFRVSKLAKLGRSTKLPLKGTFRAGKRKHGVKEFARAFGARLKSLARRQREPELAPPIAEITPPPTEVVADSRNLSAPGSSQRLAYEPPPTVLIADTNRISRAIFRKQLTLSGFRVQEATSGQDAVDKINFDTAAVLLDVHSPGGNGLHALREIRRRFAPVKIVITSADEDLETTVIAMKLGAFDSLAKNANREELVHVLTRAMQPQPVTQNIRVA